MSRVRTVLKREILLYIGNFDKIKEQNNIIFYLNVEDTIWSWFDVFLMRNNSRANMTRWKLLITGMLPD